MLKIVMGPGEAERAERCQTSRAAAAGRGGRGRTAGNPRTTPVRMYMNQMGKVPLLTREQEVEICKKIEEAEVAMKAIIYGLGFTAKEHIAIAEKLLSEPAEGAFRPRHR